MIRTTYDDRSLRVHLDSISGRVHDELLKAITASATEVKEYIKNQKLSGQVLKSITGALKDSINSSVTDHGSRITGSVYSDGSVPYASIHEYGGDIYPTAAKFLQFMIEGKQIFTKYVLMPERSFMRSSLQDYRDRLITEMDAAVRRRLIPLTQVRLHIVAGRRQRSDFCSGFRAR